MTLSSEEARDRPTDRDTAGSALLLRLLVDRRHASLPRHLHLFHTVAVPLDPAHVSTVFPPPPPLPPFSPTSLPNPDPFPPHPPSPPPPQPPPSIFESLGVIFWLAAWATLASYASALNVGGAFRAVIVGLQRRQYAYPPGYAPPPPPPGGYAVPGYAAPASHVTTVEAAKAAIAVDAGLGAVVWILAIATLILSGESGVP